MNRVEKLDVIDQAALLLSGFYVHLPQKRSARAVDPLGELRLLRDEVLRDRDLSTQQFHARMSRIFLKLADGHTRYSDGRARYVWLPFQVRRCLADGRIIFVASDVHHEFEGQGFRSGAEITHWNSTPIADAVRENGGKFYGANDEASFAQGLAYMTTRNLELTGTLPEEQVALTYRVQARSRTRIFQWRGDDTLHEPPLDGSAATDPVLHQVGHWRRRIDKAGVRPLPPQTDSPLSVEPAEGEYRSIDAELLTLDDHHYGYIRILRFGQQSDIEFKDALAGLRKQHLEGLIIDIRSNPGGDIAAMERLCKFLGARHWQVPFQLIFSEHTQRLASQFGMYNQWQPTLDIGLLTGNMHSHADFLFHHPEAAAAGTPGKMVLLIDALAYSAADMFAALFKDNGLGTIIGVDRKTGAGGGHPVTHSQLLRLFPDSAGGSPHETGDHGAIYDPRERDPARFHAMLGQTLQDSDRFVVVRAMPFDGNLDLSALSFIVVDVDRKCQYEIRIAAGANQRPTSLWYRLEEYSVESAWRDAAATDDVMAAWVQTLLPGAEPQQGGPVEIHGIRIFEFRSAEGDSCRCFMAKSHMFLARPAQLAPRPNGLKPLPGHVDLTVCLLRALRLENKTGIPIEDIGIEADKLHTPTLSDVLMADIDLKSYAIECL